MWVVEVDSDHDLGLVGYTGVVIETVSDWPDRYD